MLMMNKIDKIRTEIDLLLGQNKVEDVRTGHHRPVQFLLAGTLREPDIFMFRKEEEAAFRLLSFCSIYFTSISRAVFLSARLELHRIVSYPNRNRFSISRASSGYSHKVADVIFFLFCTITIRRKK